MKEISNSRLLDKFHDLVRTKAHVHSNWIYLLEAKEYRTAKKIEKKIDVMIDRIYNIKSILNKKLAC